MHSGFRPISEIPKDTYHAARKVFNIQHIYIRIGDQLETLLTSCDLSQLDPTATLTTDAIFRLALVTAFQYAETLPDPMASEATLRRMDWKYALYLPINYPGISEAALCSFRQNLVSRPKGLDTFSCLLQGLSRLGLFSKDAGEKSDPSAALALVCRYTRYYHMKQAMKTALGVITSNSPEWTGRNALPHWFERYKTGGLNLPSAGVLEEEAVRVGSDVDTLLAALCQKEAGPLNSLTEIRALEKLFQNQYRHDGNAIRWNLPDCPTCSIRYSA